MASADQPPPSTPVPCPQCASGISCVRTSFISVDIIAAIPDIIPTPQLFHLAPLAPSNPDYATVKNDCEATDPAIAVDEVIAVGNAFIDATYTARRAATKYLNPLLASVEKVEYHCAASSSIPSICQAGIDARIAASGPFGKGIYTSIFPSAANRHSPHQFDPLISRVMYRCLVVTGRQCVVASDAARVDLIREPPGYDSLVGDILGGQETCVYTTDRVCVTHIIIYRYTDPVHERNPFHCITTRTTVGPPLRISITHPIHILFTNLRLRAAANASRANTPDSLRNMNAAIRALCQTECTAREFLDRACAILAPSNLIVTPSNLAVIQSELERCNFSPVPAPAPAPAPLRSGVGTIVTPSAGTRSSARIAAKRPSPGCP
jgi:hypothetical protein